MDSWPWISHMPGSVHQFRVQSYLGEPGLVCERTEIEILFLLIGRDPKKFFEARRDSFEKKIGTDRLIQMWKTRP